MFGPVFYLRSLSRRGAGVLLNWIRNNYVYIAEFIGTFALMFFGTGAVVFNAMTGNGLGGIAGVAVIFGVVVALLVVLLSRGSYIHINPAVTIALWLDGRISKNRVGGYLATQFAGATLGSFAVARLIGTADSVGATIPRIGLAESFAIEVLITAILMSVVMFANVLKLNAGKKALIAGIVIAINAFIAGPLTGASMNPARSFAPALIAGVTSGQWIYIIAPVLGTVLMVALFRIVMNNSMRLRSVI